MGTLLFSNQAWLAPAILMAAALAAATLWADLRGPAGRRTKLACAALKLAGIAILTVALLEPQQTARRARPGANIFALVADNSRSLGVKDSGASMTRGETLRKALSDDKGGWQKTLEAGFQVRRYLFDSHIRAARDFGELSFDGNATALGAALKTTVEQWRGQPVAGILLFTDGNATDIGADLSFLDSAPPVYPVMIGSPDGIADISVQKISVSQTAFEDAPVSIQASVGASGMAGAEVVAQLIELGADISVTNVPVANAGTVSELSARAKGPDDQLDFRFQVQPRGLGLHYYELSARLRSELDNSNEPSREATLVNNQQLAVVDRGQEPFRVLYVGGRPNWEHKFLNRALQDDTQVHLVSLIRVARREPRFQFKGQPGETSNPLFGGFDNKDEDAARYDQPVLIRLNTKDEMELRGGFPKTAKELFQYHAVIIGDAEAEFFSREQQALLRRFVSERGGGFLMHGGAEAFLEGGYAQTPIAEMLPVYLDRPAGAALPAVVKLSLTREGWLQPWARLRATENEEKVRLDSLPGFEIWNPAKDVKPGASVLSTVTDTQGAAYPALAAQRFGLGRSAALMIGDLWSSGLRDEAAQQDLARSWRQLVRWLVSDAPSRVTVAAEPAGPPGHMRLTVRARDEEFKPLDNAEVRLSVRLAASATNHAAPLSAASAVELTAEPSTGEPGLYEAVYVAREPGAYAVEAVVLAPDGTVAGRGAAGWASDIAAAEFNSLRPNRTLLEAIAKKTGGEMVSLDSLDSFVRRLPERPAPMAETYTRPLWDKPVVFLFALTCFLAEWGLRRWKGMP